MRKLMLVIVLVVGIASVANAALTREVVAGANASSEHYSLARGPGNTINDSGMDGLGLDAQHDITYSNMWLSGAIATSLGNPNPGTVAGSHWIKFDLGAARNDLTAMGIWNGNEQNYPFFGMKDITVEYSTDNVNYSSLFVGVLPMASGGGVNPSPVDLTLDVTGLSMQYVVITAALGSDQPGGTGDRNWSYNRPTIYGEVALSEVRFFVPEPVSMLLLGLGGLAMIRRRA